MSITETFTEAENMTKTNITPSVQVSISGTKKDLKVTPKYPLESVRILDNRNGERGTQNKPHAHVKPPKWFWQK
jgi:hypothetical protein